MTTEAEHTWAVATGVLDASVLLGDDVPTGILDPRSLDAFPAPPVTGQGSPGDVVRGRYELRSLAGTGGMGAVWQAHDLMLDRPVALKEIVSPGPYGDSRSGVSRATQEARTAAHVAHPGVVGVHDIVMWADQPWIVMELLGGSTLDARISREQRLPVPTVLSVAAQLLEALAAVHEAGLVHRDVKPSNVVMGDSGRVVLTDFGLATPIGDSADFAAGRLVGSPPYIAPEALNTGVFGTATDLFSFGATLFCALEGYRPFDAGTPRATIQALRTKPVPVMRHGGALEPVVRGLLDKDPERRLTTDGVREQLGALAA